jgi:peroxiredoxin
MKSKLSISRSILAMIIAACLAAPVALGQDTAFTTPSGQQVTLSSLQGKVVIMFFSGVQDPQCRDEFKALNALAERYAGKSVSFCWVSISPVNAVSNDRLKAPCGPPGSVTVLRDPSQAAFKRLCKNQNEIPTVVVLDQKGQVRGDPISGFNPDSDFVNTLAGIVDSLLSQRKQSQ